MTYMLPETLYDEIRRAIDPMLDDGAIPDDLIASRIYLGRAESWVLSFDAQAADRPEIQLQDIHLAIIMKTASLLSLIVPQTKQTNMAGHSATFAYAETPDERSARLASEAYRILNGVLQLPSADTATMFVITTVSGRRA